MNCQHCNATAPDLSQCLRCFRMCCGDCRKPEALCYSCAGPSSKVDTKPPTHSDAVATLKALGIYEKCMEAFGWTP